MKSYTEDDTKDDIIDPYEMDEATTFVA